MGCWIGEMVATIAIFKGMKSLCRNGAGYKRKRKY